MKARLPRRPPRPPRKHSRRTARGAAMALAPARNATMLGLAPRRRRAASTRRRRFRLGLCPGSAVGLRGAPRGERLSLKPSTSSASGCTRCWVRDSRVSCERPFHAWAPRDGARSAAAGCRSPSRGPAAGGGDNRRQPSRTSHWLKRRGWNGVGSPSSSPGFTATSPPAGRRDPAFPNGAVYLPRPAVGRGARLRRRGRELEGAERRRLPPWAADPRRTGIGMLEAGGPDRLGGRTEARPPRLAESRGFETTRRLEPPGRRPRPMTARRQVAHVERDLPGSREGQRSRVLTGSASYRSSAAPGGREHHSPRSPSWEARYASKAGWAKERRRRLRHSSRTSRKRPASAGCTGQVEGCAGFAARLQRGWPSAKKTGGPPAASGHSTRVTALESEGVTDLEGEIRHDGAARRAIWSEDLTERRRLAWSSSSRAAISRREGRA